MIINVHVYSDDAKAMLAKLNRIERVITFQGAIMAGELEALTAEVERNTTVDQSAITLLNGLAAQITALKNEPAKLQAFADSLKRSSEALADAVVANTPADEGGGGELPVEVPPIGGVEGDGGVASAASKRKR